MDSFWDQIPNNLNASYLPFPTITHLLVTAEHAGFKYAGGIGSYAQEMENLLGKERLGILFVGEKEFAPGKFPSKEFTEAQRWFTPLTFHSDFLCQHLPKADLVWETIQQILYYYPNLRTLEFQDCDGFAVRVAQAKKAGLLPTSLEIKIRCHGTYVYLEQAHGKWWTDRYHLRLMVEEKQAIEAADTVSFATDFLHGLYVDSGYRIRPRQVEKLRYPMALPQAPEPVRFQPVDTLIFIGSRTTMKGFHSFVDALRKLVDLPQGKSLKQVWVLGSTDPSMDRENALLKELGTRITTREASLPREKVLETLAANRHRALCVLPYQGDNHPNAVLETMACGCQMLAANKGGIPELVPKAFHEQTLCEPEVESLVSHVKRIMAQSPKERQELADGLWTAFSQEQEDINQAHLDMMDRQPGPAVAHEVANREVVLLTVGMVRNKKKMARALEAQIRHADHDYQCAWTNFHQCLARIVQDHKDGICIVLENRYYPEPDFILHHAAFLEANPDMAAVSAYCKVGDEAPAIFIRPLGDGLLLSLYEDECLGHNAAAFSLPRLKDLGLPDESRRTSVRDLFTALMAADEKLGVIPKSLSHRIPGKESPQGYAAAKGQSAYLKELPRFEALHLAGVMQDYAAIQQTAAIAMARELENYPRLVKAGKTGLEKAAKFYFKFKKS